MSTAGEGGSLCQLHCTYSSTAKDWGDHSRNEVGASVSQDTGHDLEKIKFPGVVNYPHKPIKREALAAPVGFCRVPSSTLCSSASALMAQMQNSKVH